MALLAEGMCPGGEDTTIEEYIVSPAIESISIKEAGKDCIKLYGANQGVSMIAQPVSGQGSMISRSMLTLSRQGSVLAQAASNLKDPMVNLFGSMHDANLPPELFGGSRGSMIIPKVPSVSSMGADHDQSPFGTSDNLHAPLLNAIDKAFGSKDMSGMSSNSNLRGNMGLAQGSAGEIPKNTNIGGGWQLVYKSVDQTTGGGKKEGGGGLQRVYLHADPTTMSREQSSLASISGYDLHEEGGGEAFQASALVSRSILYTKDMTTKPQAPPKRVGWGALLEPGVKRALIVGVGLQILQQVHLDVLIGL